MVLYGDRVADHDVAEGGDSDLVYKKKCYNVDDTMAILFTKKNVIMLMILLILTGTRRFQAMIMWSRIVLKRHKAGELVIVKMRMVDNSVCSKR